MGWNDKRGLYLAQLFRQLSVLMAAGLPLEKSLSVCSDQTSFPPLRSGVSRLADEVRHGVRLSDALAGVGDPFTLLHSGAVKAAEATGNYEAVFEQLATWEEKDEATEQRVRAFTTYPILLIAISFIGMILLLKFLVPLIVSAAADLNRPIPVPTRVVLLMGKMVDNPIFLVLVIPAIWGGRRLWRAVLANEATRMRWDEIRLNLPLFGPVVRLVWMVRACRCLNSLLLSSLPMTTAVELAGRACGNLFMERQVLREAVLGILKGETLSQALSSRHFSKTFLGMVMVGEGTGSLPQMLGHIADLYEVEFENAIESILRAAEPLILIVVGGVVFVVLGCAFLPLYDLIGKIGT